MVKVDYGKKYDTFIKRKWHDCQKQGMTNAIGKALRYEIHHVVPKALQEVKRLKQIVDSAARNTVLMPTDDHIYAHLLLTLGLLQRNNNDYLKMLSFTRPMSLSLFLKLKKQKFFSDFGFNVRDLNKAKKRKQQIINQSRTMTANEAMHYMAFQMRLDPALDESCCEALNAMMKSATHLANPYGLKWTLIFRPQARLT